MDSHHTNHTMISAPRLQHKLHTFASASTSALNFLATPGRRR